MIITRIIISIISGTMSSMGIGAGSVMLLYLTVFENIDQRVAVFINLLFSIPIAILSIYFHNKNKLIPNKDLCKKMSLLGIIGCITGSLLSFVLPVYFIKKIFGIFIIFIGIRSLIK